MMQNEASLLNLFTNYNFHNSRKMEKCKSLSFQESRYSTLKMSSCLLNQVQRTSYTIKKKKFKCNFVMITTEWVRSALKIKMLSNDCQGSFNINYCVGINLTASLKIAIFSGGFLNKNDFFLFLKFNDWKVVLRE